MTNHLDLIFVAPHQIIPLVVVLILWAALAGLGSLLTSKSRITEANFIFGWAAISSVFTVVGVFVRAPFFYLALLAALLAATGLYRAVKSGTDLFIPGSWRIIVLALPLFWIAGAMDPSQWDEFSHWMPAPKYLLALDGFPNKARPYLTTHMLPAYPYGWPFLSYLSGLIAGKFINNIGAALNLMLLLSFSTFALRTAFRIAGKTPAQTIGWGFAAATVFCSTLFNPTFIQKLVLTAYSDVATSVGTGFCLLIGYFYLESLAGRKSVKPLAMAWQLSLALMLLVNLRQSNLVIFLILVTVFIFLAARDKRIYFTEFLKQTPVIILPALLVYAAWRYHVVNELDQISGAEATFQPFDMWNISVIPQILGQMSYVAFKKIGFFAPMVIASIFALRALFKLRTDFDRIALITGALFVGYNAFLLLTYVGHFGRSAALSVVSYWRYNTQIGMSAVAFITIGLVYYYFRKRQVDAWPDWIRSAAIISIVALPFIFAHKLRFDLEPPKPHFIAVAKDMIGILPKGSKFHLLDPTGTGEAALITRFHLDHFGTNWLAALSKISPEKIQKFAGNVAMNNYLLVHSIAPGAVEALNVPMEREHSYLLRKTKAGWKLIRSWRKPANHRW